MNTPMHKLGQAMIHMQEQGKRPCFHIGGLHITIANPLSANPGSLYIKDDNWDYIGKVDTKGYMSIRYPSRITDSQRILILDAMVNPEGTAMTNGKKTGTCCCCGRKLTNKLSIELGIGPICRGHWFPVELECPLIIPIAEAIETTTVREMITDLESSDGLELDLGMPYGEPKVSIATISEPTVEELVIIYKSLNPDQKNVFLKLIEGKN